MYRQKGIKGYVWTAPSSFISYNHFVHLLSLELVGMAPAVDDEMLSSIFRAFWIT